MEFAGTAFIITLILQSYILADKTHIEKIKLYRYILNASTLIIAGIMFYMTADLPEEYYKLNGSYFAIAFLVLDIISMIELYYLKKNRLDSVLIKNTIDNSDTGIMTITYEDKVIFQNSSMYNIVNFLNIHKDYLNNIKTKAIQKIGNEYILFKDDKAILFRLSHKEDEITAYDISEEYILQNKLKKQNETIKQNNENLLWTIEHLDDVEREEKSLKIKNKFHDLLGQNLSILQAYLNQEVQDEKKFVDVKFMIKKTFSELDDIDNPFQALDDLIKINENIGVRVNLNGKLPQNKELAKIFFEIIREAVTNAIRHAESTEINIKIEDTLTEVIMTISNNGKQSKEKIIENEGIKGMRRKLKEKGGTLFVTTRPIFSLQIKI